MKTDYTIISEQSLENSDLTSDSDAAAKFLCDKDQKNFRPFDKGLTELLQKAGFTGDASNIYDKTDFLTEKLQAINSSITRKTVLAWFDGKRRPKIEPISRPKIYEICFALNLDFDKVKWFFQHVYYDRTFNCHDIAEVVYYYAFLKNLSYDEATKIIAEIEAAPAQNDFDGGAVYTNVITGRVRSIETVDELKNFLIEQKKNFSVWNQSALEKIHKLAIKMVGDETICKAIFQKLKKAVDKKKGLTISFNDDEINRCGLWLRHICRLAWKGKDKYSAEKIRGAISGKNIFSYAFVLDCFLGTTSGIDKDIDLPYILKNNFPSKKVLSDVLDENKVSVSKSYDAIRKTLILFNFYEFWYEIELGDVPYLEDDNIEDLPEIYLEQINSELAECGYESLYTGNPYDWLFLCAARSKDPHNPKNLAYPIEFFKSTVENLAGAS